jgi:hypothetical protein
MLHAAQPAAGPNRDHGPRAGHAGATHTALYVHIGAAGRGPKRSLNVTCVQCENSKSISPIYSTQLTMAHDADTDSDLARPPDSKHPSARIATPAMLLRSATRRRNAGHVVAHPGPGDSDSRSEATVERWMEAARTTRSSRRSGPAAYRAQPVEGREQ